MFAVSHGQFLNSLVVALMQGAGEKSILETGQMNPNNNALTIIDFDVEDKEHFRGDHQVTVVNPRLVAHNLQVIQNNSDKSAKDFEP